jgi:hypothetical protein
VKVFFVKDLRGRKTGVHLHPLLRNENVLWQIAKAQLTRVLNKFLRKKKKLENKFGIGKLTTVYLPPQFKK